MKGMDGRHAQTIRRYTDRKGTGYIERMEGQEPYQRIDRVNLTKHDT